MIKFIFVFFLKNQKKKHKLMNLGKVQNKEKKYNFIDILYYISYEKLEEFA